MSFSNRILVANTIINELEQNYWNLLKKPYNMVHGSYGYETHIANDLQKLLIGDYSNTSKHIRFSPDYILARKFNNNITRTILLEYKVTRTPRYTLREQQWDIGQIEADAWDNYRNLAKAGVVVAVIIYCPYHSRPLLCDFPNANWLTQSRSKTFYSRGSGTDYVNIDFNLLRSFDQFMENEFSIPKTQSEYLLSKQFFHNLMNNPELTIDHAPRSNYREYQTGFNWSNRYK